MKNKKLLLILIIIIASITIVHFLAIRFQLYPDRFIYSDKFESAELIIKKIEIFRNQKRMLPNSLSELGIKDQIEGPVYYQQTDENKYQLWFGTTLGESITYNSDSKQWE